MRFHALENVQRCLRFLNDYNASLIEELKKKKIQLLIKIKYVYMCNVKLIKNLDKNCKYSRRRNRRW